MKIHRIRGVILRYLYLLRHSYDRLNDMFYWPLIDLTVWGITSTYFKTLNPATSDIVLAIVAGILFWLIVNRGQFEVSISLLEDLWNENLINMFVSPLSFWEWVSSFLILGVIKASISFLFAASVAFLFYKIQIFQFGLYIVPFGFLLLMTGWWVGFTIGGLILRFGTKIQTFAWSLPALIAPFSAIYYPVSILPTWTQHISYMLPTTYVFIAMKEVIKNGSVDMHTLYMSLFLNVVYLFLSILFLRSSFKSVLQRGMIHLG